MYHSFWISMCSPTWKKSVPCHFMEASFHRHGWSNHWLVLIDSTSIPRSHPKKLGIWPNVPTLCSHLVPLATSSHPYMLFKSHPAMVERGLLWITRYPFHFVALKRFQELRAGDQTWSQKIFPLILSLQGFGKCEPGIMDKDQTYMKILFGHLNQT